MGCSIFKAGHGLPYAVPTRTAPDPTLFPYYMQNAQGLWLRYTEWWPRREEAALKGVVYIVSGIGEHGGRYDSVALRFTRAGFACFSIDNQGAGGSEGVRLYAERFDDLVADIRQFVGYVAVRHPEVAQLPRFLLGHSMGGLIAVHVAMRDGALFRGVVLSGPAFAPAEAVGGFLGGLVKFLSRHCPKLPVKRLNTEYVSSNRPVVELAQQDPYYSNASLRARFVAELLAAQDEVFKHIDTDRCAFPFFIVFGESDRLCSLNRARDFFARAKAEDKHMRMYSKAYHEVLTETCRETVMDDVLNFVESRCGM